jgi:hypothetical protein
MSRISLAAVVTLLALFAGFPDPGSAQSPPVPCQPVVPCLDPAGCPDLVVDRRHLGEWFVQAQTFSPLDCSVQEGHIQAGRRLLLQFPTWLSNVGAGDLTIGDPQSYPDLFEFATCHGHYHVRDYAVYRLWRPALYLDWLALKAAHPEICSAELLRLHPEFANQVVAGFKQGFCVVPETPVCEPAPPPNPIYNCEYQGFDAGWTDVYSVGTEGQWIDITEVPKGRYIFESEVNSERRIQESNYANDAATIVIVIK